MDTLKEFYESFTDCGHTSPCLCDSREDPAPKRFKQSNELNSCTITSGIFYVDKNKLSNLILKSTTQKAGKSLPRTITKRNTQYNGKASPAVVRTVVTSRAAGTTNYNTGIVNQMTARAGNVPGYGNGSLKLTTNVQRKNIVLPVSTIKQVEGVPRVVMKKNANGSHVQFNESSRYVGPTGQMVLSRTQVKNINQPVVQLSGSNVMVKTRKQVERVPGIVAKRNSMGSHVQLNKSSQLVPGMNSNGPTGQMVPSRTLLKQINQPTVQLSGNNVVMKTMKQVGGVPGIVIKGNSIGSNVQLNPISHSVPRTKSIGSAGQMILSRTQVRSMAQVKNINQPNVQQIRSSAPVIVKKPGGQLGQIILSRTSIENSNQTYVQFNQTSQPKAIIKSNGQASQIASSTTIGKKVSHTNQRNVQIIQINQPAMERLQVCGDVNPNVAAQLNEIRRPQNIGPRSNVHNGVKVIISGSTKSLINQPTMERLQVCGDVNPNVAAQLNEIRPPQNMGPRSNVHNGVKVIISGSTKSLLVTNNASQANQTSNNSSAMKIHESTLSATNGKQMPVTVPTSGTSFELNEIISPVIATNNTALVGSYIPGISPIDNSVQLNESVPPNITIDYSAEIAKDTGINIPTLKDEWSILNDLSPQLLVDTLHQHTTQIANDHQLGNTVVATTTDAHLDENLSFKETATNEHLMEPQSVSLPDEIWPLLSDLSSIDCVNSQPSSDFRNDIERGQMTPDSGFCENLLWGNENTPMDSFVPGEFSFEDFNTIGEDFNAVISNYKKSVGEGTEL